MGRDEAAVFRRRGPAADLKVGRNYILRTHVHGLHEPPRLISTDGKNRCVQRSKATSNLCELRVKTRVAGKENSMAADAYDPTAPKGGIPVPGITPGEMLRRSAPCRYCAQAARLPPVHLDDMSCAPLFQKITDAKRYDPLCERKSGNKMTHGLVIEVIVMIVRDENCVDGRERVEGHAGRRVSPGSGKLNRRSSVAPDRIGKDADSVRPDEEAAMAYPGNCKSGIVRIGS